MSVYQYSREQDKYPLLRLFPINAVPALFQQKKLITFWISFSQHPGFNTDSLENIVIHNDDQR